MFPSAFLAFDALYTLCILLCALLVGTFNSIEMITYQKKKKKEKLLHDICCVYHTLTRCMLYISHSHIIYVVYCITLTW